MTARALLARNRHALTECAHRVVQHLATTPRRMSTEDMIRELDLGTTTRALGTYLRYHPHPDLRSIHRHKARRVWYHARWELVLGHQANAEAA